MLQLKHLFENFTLAKEALQHWEHDLDTLDTDLSLFRISSNAIYPFHQKGKLCFLRLAPKDEKLQSNITGELEFIEYLRACGYPALEPIMARSGAVCIELDTHWGRYYASAFYGVRGMAIGSVEMSDTVLYQYGKALGRLHALSSGFTPTIHKWSHTQVLDWVNTVLMDCDAAAYVVWELEVVRDQLSRLPIDQTKYGLVHYDFEPDNVFYEPITKSCFVIDFDDGMYHWYALDIEQVFDSLGECLIGQQLKEAKEIFISGYRSEYCFDPQAESLLPLMRRFIDLYTYARLIRSVAEHMDDEPDWLLALRKKLGKVITNLENKMRLRYNA